MRSTQPAAASGGTARVLWLGWLLFVVYGSLVPLEFHAVPLSDALERFAHLPLLNIDVRGRADWVANGVLFLPVGFLTALVLTAGRPERRLWACGAALLVVGAMAVMVEFVQLYFPPRTVSLNDLLAEFLGGLLGALLAWSGAGWLRAARALLGGPGRRLAGWTVPAGVLLLVVLSLFPFDLLISTSELAAKLRGPAWGWWRAPLFAGDPLSLTVARGFAEALVLVPLGAWWAQARLVGSRPASLTSLLWRGALLGAALGGALELAQWLVASGVSQGQSVLSRAIGWATGVWVGYASRAWGMADWQARLRRWTLPVGVCLLLSAVAKAGWLTGPWRSPGEALARLSGNEIHFLPFYYHYFTSEGAAVQSVVPVVLLFAPVGLLCWAWGRTPGRAAGWAALGSAVLEGGRLFMVEARPDPTNVLIAMTAAGISVWLLQRVAAGTFADLEGASNVIPPPGQTVAAASGPRPNQRASRTDRPGQSSVVWLVLAAALALAWLSRFPVFQWGLGAMLVTGAVLVWWRPVLLVTVAVATVPLLNLSVWSGREFVDEFDVLLLLCLAVAWVRRSRGAGTLPRDGVLSAAVGLMIVSLLASTLLGWAPWDTAALQHPASPLSPWYSVRLFKGALWAWLLCAVARRQHSAGEPVVQAFGVGMVLGLAGVLAFVLWERMAFVGVFNFTDAYRVAGPVLPMRLGGAYLDAFFVASLPFAMTGVLYARSLAWRLACTGVAMGAAYGMAVTFTRSTYLAAAVVSLLMALGALRPWPGKARGRVWMATGMLALLVVAAYPIITGPFASARLAVVTQDMGTRMGHARQVIFMGGGDVVSTVFGQGLGRFPANNYWMRQSARASTGGMAVHQFLWEDGVSQLQLGAGPVLFMDQAVTVTPGQQIRIGLKARADGPGAKLAVMLCHKWLLSSDSCELHMVSVAGPEKGWQPLQATLKTKGIGGDVGMVTRPVRFTLHNAGHARIDIDVVSARDEQGRELILNGDFDASSDHWNYTSDDHMAWHVKNMPLAVWFDLGWLGVLAFAALLGLGLRRSARAAWAGDRGAQGLSAALIGLMVVAMFDSVVDEPRFLFLLLVLSWLAAVVKPAQSGVPPLSR